jgi:hypothetical protein
MLDYSACLTQSEIHRKKAEAELVLINAGLSPSAHRLIKAKGREQLCLMLADVVMAIAWVDDQR